MLSFEARPLDEQRTKSTDGHQLPKPTPVRRGADRWPQSVRPVDQGGARRMVFNFGSASGYAARPVSTDSNTETIDRLSTLKAMVWVVK